ncbi:MAG: hypothetical protein ING70_10895 [Rhodocyclaceae bacterium]|jgi:hypothetical protein|nr:hypothetical protein [Rhodocyclaceae bacterium]MCA3146153.1 hypothetical protein [Rhodocyclaceae bacterium]
MTTKLLQEAVLDGGIRSVNFFNGRLLTGKDLSREQDARRQSDRRIAQANGHGIAWGLEVENVPAGDPRVRVQPGLAVSRSGRALYLESETEVTLGRRAPPRAVASRTFDDCGRLTSGTYAAAPGIYLLTLAPAEDREGKALTHALDDAAVPCNTDTLVEAVQFRLLPLGQLLEDERLAIDQRPSKPDAPAKLSLWRNRIAHRCFGADALRAFITDPLGAGKEPYGLLAGLADKALSDCDVPLAIVKLEVNIDFVDQWSVRRRITQRCAAGAWPMVAGDRRLAEGEAMFLQFQEHLASLLGSSADARGISALQRFDYLPPAGFIPMPGNPTGDAAAIARFFDGLTVRGPAHMEGANLERLIRDSYAYPPIDLASGELIWLYYVRENRQALDYKLTPAPRACLVFATGHMPYRADARFNLSRWDYANTPIDR